MNRNLKCILSSKGLKVLVLAGVMLFGCQQKSQESSINSDKTEKFLRHAMITHCGAYTLVGAKPITEFSNLTTEPTQEDLMIIYKNISPKARERYSFQEVSSHFIEEYELWQAWSKKQKELVGPNYLFFANPRIKNQIMFVNLWALSLVLDKHYEDFKKVYGKDFDPTEVIYLINSAESDFWSKSFSDHYLSGLLFGFGKANAKLFSWEQEKKKPGAARSGTYAFPIPVNNPTIPELPLPSFVIYSPLDRKLLFYKGMRKNIIKLYENKDFKNFTVKLLKDNSCSLKEL